jgi:hypothetical protein
VNPQHAITVAGVQPLTCEGLQKFLYSMKALDRFCRRRVCKNMHTAGCRHFRVVIFIKIKLRPQLEGGQKHAKSKEETSFSAEV